MSRGAELPGHINNPARAARIDTSRNLSAPATGHTERAQGPHCWLVAPSGRATTTGRRDRTGHKNKGPNGSELRLRIHDTFALTGQPASASQPIRREASIDGEGAVEAPLPQNGETLTIETPTRCCLDITPTVHGTFLQSKGEPTTASIDLTHRVGFEALRARPGKRWKHPRPPDSMERFGDRGTMIGNPDLSPERGWQWDVGLRARFNAGQNTRWRLDVAHFWVASKDRIT